MVCRVLYWPLNPSSHLLNTNNARLLIWHWCSYQSVKGRSKVTKVKFSVQTFCLRNPSLFCPLKAVSIHLRGEYCHVVPIRLLRVQTWMIWAVISSISLIYGSTCLKEVIEEVQAYSFLIESEKHEFHPLFVSRLNKDSTLDLALILIISW
jgi:hypothetical protein